MKLRLLLMTLLAVLMTLLGESAWAHGSRSRVGVGFYFGGPVWGSMWYPPPMYYPPQVVVVPPPVPPVYIEQNEAPAEAGTQQYWYYCKGSKGYYPYVKECPEGWQKVLPQPEK